VGDIVDFSFLFLQISFTGLSSVFIAFALA
jgi:hypothetical protein